MSSASQEAKRKYNQSVTVGNAGNYFSEVVFDNSATNSEKAEAAQAYYNAANWYGKYKLKDYTRSARDYYSNNPNKIANRTTNSYAVSYVIAAFRIGASREELFNSYFEFYKTMDDNSPYKPWKHYIKSYLDSLYNSIINSPTISAQRKESIKQSYMITIDPYQEKYNQTKARYNEIILSGTEQQKYEAAKAYYEAAKAYSETTPQQKYEAAKAYHDAAESWGATTYEQKLVAATAYKDTAQAYYYSLSDPQKLDVASDFFEATDAYELSTSQAKNQTAMSFYTATINFRGTASEKYAAAKAYYESTNNYESATSEQKYASAKAYYDTSIAPDSNVSNADKLESVWAYYNAAIMLKDNTTIKYIAAATLLEYILKYDNNTDKSEIAKTLYENSPSGTKFDSAKIWYEHSIGTSKNAAAEAYYKESKDRSCNDKCVATNAYFHNGGKTDTTVGFENTYYTGKMGGEKCNIPINVCNPSEGFQNREPMACQQKTQAPIFKSAESAYLTYKPSENPKYSEIATINKYFELATKENGLNKEDIMNVAKNRVKFIQSMKTIDYDKLRTSAQAYYDAAGELDCGDDKAYNKYLAAKTFYEILERSNDSSKKAEISKQYYMYTIDADAKRSNAEKYTVAKIWFENSPTIDSARAVYDCAVMLDSRATDDEKYTAVIKFQNLGGALTDEQKKIILAKHEAALSVRTDQIQEKQRDSAIKAYDLAIKKESFTVKDFSLPPPNCNRGSTVGLDPECLAYSAYTQGKTPQEKLTDAERWSGLNYKKDIVDRRKELDVELSKLNKNAEVNIQKMDLDSTIMMNIAVTVLASSLIVFSITKL
jgi:hypothetical protein